MKADKNGDAQERILKAAEEEFAGKGFDGARVDVIASKAGVNKALIYYYYKSKQNLLNALIDRMIHKGIGMASLVRELERLPTDAEGRGIGIFRELIAFLIANENLLRIMMSEGLKTGGSDILSKLSDIYLDSRITGIVEQMKNKGVIISGDKRQWIITELFTALFPTILYTVFRRSLAERFESDVDELDMMFLNSLFETHLHSHDPKEEG